MGKLEHSFIQMFKSNVSKMINNKERKKRDSLSAKQRNIDNKQTLNVLINCDLVSIECNRWRKCVENKQQINVSNKVYDILKQKNNDENIMQYIYIDGVIQHHHVQKMSHLPYISFIIRPKKNAKNEFQAISGIVPNSTTQKIFCCKVQSFSYRYKRNHVLDHSVFDHASNLSQIRLEYKMRCDS